MISAIVLAAGESKRMGETKQLLPWWGKPLLQHVLDDLLESKVDEIVLVLGHDADKILKKVPQNRIKVVINPDYKKGMSSSIRQGLLAMEEEAEAFLIVLGDQPGIGKAVVNRLIGEFERVRPEKNIFLPTYRGSSGHPVLFAMKYRKEALQLGGDRGCRQILADHPEDTLAIEMETDTILHDIDTPEDYRGHLKKKPAGEKE